jgi:hypothetical protein
MRYSFVPSPNGPGGFGTLVDDETGDLINFGAYYRMALERDDLLAAVAAERARREKAEEVVDLLLVPVVIEDDLSELIQEAQSYRSQYPKE